MRAGHVTIQTLSLRMEGKYCWEYILEEAGAMLDTSALLWISAESLRYECDSPEEWP